MKSQSWYNAPVMRLRQLIPTNIQEEREKFFSDFSYNPQFTYDEEINPDFVGKYDYLIADPNVNELAFRIAKEALQFRNHADLQMMNGHALLSKKEVTEQIEAFLKLHDLEKDFRIVWTDAALVRTSITGDTILLHNTSEFRKYDLHGMLYHEIGTHALRRKNYEQQPWYRKKKKYGFRDYLLTEEGLATAHGLIPQKVLHAYKPAISYITCMIAHEHSFSETFHLLEEYISDPEARWKKIVRIKRGISDTSVPGGFMKDCLYFEGLVEVVRWLLDHDCNITPLYYGKLAYQDIDKALQLNPGFKPQLPIFYLSDRTAYAKSIKEIAEQNYIK